MYISRGCLFCSSSKFCFNGYSLIGNIDQSNAVFCTIITHAQNSRLIVVYRRQPRMHGYITTYNVHPVSSLAVRCLMRKPKPCSSIRFIACRNRCDNTRDPFVFLLQETFWFQGSFHYLPQSRHNTVIIFNSSLNWHAFHHFNLHWEVDFTLTWQIAMKISTKHHVLSFTFHCDSTTHDPLAYHTAWSVTTSPLNGS